ncbi:hypothetical protein CU669_19635 [Paramagnetospirillum kuznetsovii]|uniref:DUF91 domain-containing protein n=1 Tax=Paramagnetospirillum kuznetsovii TaxID=2053833 RepID=A0A364NSY7_9PROT|nr:hypothetical protein [Paramagnetospirillum kuznetsovii]RAU20199.1 hypothetical protein CU669_19635 [Paramagnetospirillum kuznetsovii]
MDLVLKRHDTTDAYKEDLLQHIVDTAPEVLPLAEIDRGFVGARSICRELPFSLDLQRAKRLDNLLITPDGGIVLVECKLIRNNEAKIAVVSQLLGYLTDISKWRYSDLEQAVKAVRAEMKCEDSSLYELANAGSVGLDEIEFSEIVDLNLRRGRMLALIVGDGVSDRVQDIAEFLSGKATTPFTLGLVKLDIFRMPGNDDSGYLVLPQVQVRTQVYEIPVRVLQGGIVAEITNTENDKTALSPQKIRATTSEQGILDALKASAPDHVDAVSNFISDCKNLGCEIKSSPKSFSICAIDPLGNPWNLARFHFNGKVLVDSLAAQDRAAGTDIGKSYQYAVAALIPGGRVKTTPKTPNWATVVNANGGDLQIADMMAIKERWLDLIAATAEAIRSVGLGDGSLAQ